MDTRLKSVSLLALVLLASLFTSLLPVSEARPLFSSSPSKDHGIIREVNGVFRTLKSSGPSPGIGHRLKKLQNLGGMKDSGPSPGQGHKLFSFLINAIAKIFRRLRKNQGHADMVNHTPVWVCKTADTVAELH
ncbi:hypothetical protein E2542_SST22475 [Spatholobus suberectus]|nr:hypothetical protein E2542_SST22475 [Spatholobus suberectus]